MAHMCLFSSTRLILYLLILLVLVSSVISLKCFDCIGKDKCKNPTEKQCSPNETTCNNAKDAKGDALSKNCAGDPSAGDPGINECKDSRDDGNKLLSTHCRCNKDKCNAGCRTKSAEWITLFCIGPTGFYILLRGLQ